MPITHSRDEPHAPRDRFCLGRHESGRLQGKIIVNI